MARPLRAKPMRPLPRNHTAGRRWTALDWLLGLLLTAGLAWLAWRVHVGLNYHWRWEAIPQYLWRRDADGAWVPGLLGQGLLTTLRLCAWAMVLGCLGGFALGLMRAGVRPLPRLVARGYVELIRNLPPLVLVFIFYFFLSTLLLPGDLLDAWARGLSEPGQRVLSWLCAPPERFSNFVSAIVTLALYEAAYIAEIVRAGVQSIHKGQWEAAAALGLSRRQQLRHVVLPQALARVVPPLAGQMVSAIKDSAIVSVISIAELTFQGLELMAATYLTFEVWLTITGLYLILTASCAWMADRLEARLNRGIRA